jgi:adenylate cyclase
VLGHGLPSFESPATVNSNSPRLSAPRGPLLSPPSLISSRRIRLDPAIKHLYVHFLGSAYLVAGDDKAAASLFRERILLSPKTDLSRAFLTVALGHLGEIEEAGQVWRELMQINPKYAFVEHVGRLPFRNKVDVDRLAEGLSKARIAA